MNPISVTKTQFILYVKDQARSTAFYSHVLSCQPSLNVPGMTEFTLSENGILGLMPEAGIRRLLGEKLPDPAQSTGIPRSELYLLVHHPLKYHQRAIQAGAVELSGLEARDWGHRAAYSLDPDGYVLAFAEPIESGSGPTMDSEYLLRRWRNVRAGLIDTLAKFRDEELDFKPYAAGWSVRQLMLHIAHEEHGEFAYGVAQTLAEFPPEYDPQAHPSLTAIHLLLESVHAQTLDSLNQLKDADLDQVIVTPWGATYHLVEMIDHLIEHEVHHRAELSLILGMLGREGFDA